MTTVLGPPGVIMPSASEPASTTGRAGVRPVLVDVAFTLAIMIMVGLEYAFPFDDGTHAGDQRLSLVLSLLMVAPLALRRVRPLAAFLLMCGLIGLPSVWVPHTFLFFGGQLPVMLGVATVFRYHRLRVALVAPVALTLALALLLLHGRDDNPSNLLFVAVFVLVAALIGVVLRRSALQRERLAAVLAEVSRANEVRDAMAVLDERSRVARDLHDVVAHAVSLMLVQAGAARLALADGDARVAAEFLAGVEQAGAGAERELDAMLRALRTDTEHPHERAPAIQARDQAELSSLLDRMRAAGLDLTVRLIGDRPAPSPGLDLAVYRIVQEGLTNVLRHAGPTEVELTIDHHDPLTVTMIDSGPRGPRPPAPASGQGLIGMAERVALFDGTLQSEPLARGWLLRVKLPTGASR